MLKKAGTDKTRIITANIWLSDISTFGEMNAVWDAWVVPDARPPARLLNPSLPRPNTRWKSWLRLRSSIRLELRKL